MLFGFFPLLVKEMHAALANLDGLMGNQFIATMEHAGWQLPTPTGSCRQWHNSIRSYGKKVTGEIIEQYMKYINANVDALESSIPSWTACFSADGLDEEMAVAGE